MKLDWALIVFTLMAVGTGLGCYLLFGPEVFLDSLESDLDLIGFVLPRLGAAMLIAGFVQVLLPPGFFARMMGEESGVKGLAVATVAGAVTPGGPMTSFPIVTMMRDCGTGAPALVAYVTAWSTLGLQRVFLWEVPLMGVEFAALRFLVSLPLGVIAGLLMRFMPPPSPAYPDGSEG